MRDPHPGGCGCPLLSLLFFFLLLPVLVRPAGAFGQSTLAFTLLGHQAAVVLVAGVIPRRLTRGEVEEV